MKTIWEDSFLYTYFVEEETNLFTEFQLEYLPAGYGLEEKLGNDNSYSSTYTNAVGEQIVFDQYRITDNRKIVMDLDYDKETVVTVNGVPLIIYSYADGFVSSYYEYQNNVFLLTADNLSREETVKIFEHLETSK